MADDVRPRKHYFISNTGDVIKYVGETLTDPHKGEYSSEYLVVIGNKFKKNDFICDYELYDRKTYEQYKLVELPDNIDLSNIKNIEVLYGSR